MSKYFLLPHYDDEILMLPLFDSEEKNFLIYLTNGISRSKNDESEIERFREAIGNLRTQLKNFQIEIICLGKQLQIYEGQLHNHLHQVDNDATLSSILKNAQREDVLVTTTFEGAHQDHDAASILSRKYATKFGINLVEVSTYPQVLKGIYSFSVMRPRHRLSQIPFRRLRIVSLALNLMIGYRTQRRTWLGLGFQTLFSYLFLEFFTSKPMNLRIIEKCFYEFRRREEQSEVFQKLSEWSTS